MPEYSRRPGAPNESGREAVARLERETAAARRDRPQFEKSNGLVKLELEEVESWPPGTARLVGDDYPLEVKLTDGTWLPIPPPAAAGGSMQGFTRARPNAGAWDGVSASGWTFDTTVDVSPGAKPALVTNDGLYFGPTVPGWYSTHAQIQFNLGSGDPAGVLVQANNNSSNVSTFGEVWAQNLWDGRYRASFWCGPFWLDGASTPLGLRALVPGSWTPGALFSTFVDVWRVG